MEKWMVWFLDPPVCILRCTWLGLVPTYSCKEYTLHLLFMRQLKTTACIPLNLSELCSCSVATVPFCSVRRLFDFFLLVNKSVWIMKTSEISYPMHQLLSDILGGKKYLIKSSCHAVSDLSDRQFRCLSYIISNPRHEHEGLSALAGAVRKCQNVLIVYVKNMLNAIHNQAPFTFMPEPTSLCTYSGWRWSQRCRCPVDLVKQHRLPGGRTTSLAQLMVATANLPSAPFLHTVYNAFSKFTNWLTVEIWSLLLWYDLTRQCTSLSMACIHFVHVIIHLRALCNTLNGNN